MLLHIPLQACPPPWNSVGLGKACPTRSVGDGLLIARGYATYYDDTRKQSYQRDPNYTKKSPNKYKPSETISCIFE